MSIFASQYRTFKILSPAGCVIAFLGFFLTFTDLNCNGKTLDTISGMELATGYQPDINLTDSNDDEQKKEERYDPNIFALNAWIAALLGIILVAIPKLRNLYSLHAIIAAIGLFCMIGLNFNLKNALNSAKSGSGTVNVDLPITFDMQPGYWMVCFAFFMTLVADLALLWHLKQVQDEMKQHLSSTPDHQEEA